MPLEVIPSVAFGMLSSSKEAELIDMRKMEHIVVSGFPDLSSLSKATHWLSFYSNSFLRDTDQDIDAMVESFVLLFSDFIKTHFSETINSEFAFLLLCRRGHVSSLCAERLRGEFGFKVVSVAHGFNGLDGWLDSDLPFKSCS